MYWGGGALGRGGLRFCCSQQKRQGKEPSKDVPSVGDGSDWCHPWQALGHRLFLPGIPTLGWGCPACISCHSVFRTIYSPKKSTCGPIAVHHHNISMINQMWTRHQEYHHIFTCRCSIKTSSIMSEYKIQMDLGIVVPITSCYPIIMKGNMVTLLEKEILHYPQSRSLLLCSCLTISLTVFWPHVIARKSHKTLTKS